MAVQVADGLAVQDAHGRASAPVRRATFEVAQLRRLVEPEG